MHRLNIKLVTLLVIFCFGIILSGCSTYVPYSLELKRKYQLTNDDLNKIQFYLSQKVELQREITTKDNKEIARGHSLKTERGKLIETIAFDSKLEGIVFKAYDDSLLVSFESKKYLTFIKCRIPVNGRMIDQRQLKLPTNDNYNYPPPGARFGVV